MVISLCKFVDPFKIILNKIRERAKVKIIKMPIRMEKTIGYFESCYSSRSCLSHSVSQRDGKSWDKAVKRHVNMSVTIPQFPYE